MFVRRVISLLLCLSATLLTACGSSSSSPPPPPPPPPPPVNTAALPITGDNAQDITVAVLNSVTSAANLLDVGEVIGLPVANSPGPGIQKPGQDVHEVTTPCDAGEFTTVWDDADNDLDVSTGDTFMTTFDMCFFQDDGVTIDGVSDITEMVVTGDPFTPTPPYGLIATFGFTDLVATDAVETVTINGDLDIDLNSDDDIVINATLATALLSVDVDGAMESLTDYLMTQVIDRNAQTQDIAASGAYTSDVLEGTVTFETMENFMVMGDNNPSSGQLFIADATSSVLFTVLDNLNVRLEIDVDLDGMIDETIDLLWTDLGLN
jgi:hypothetical protein